MGFLSSALKSTGMTGGGLLEKLRGSGTGKYRAGLAGIINQARESNRLYGDQARDQLRQGLTATLKGYDQAITKTSGLERTARRDAKERAGEVEADVLNKYGQSGRFGTTALDNARRGISSSLARDMASIESNFASLFSELSTGRGGAEMGGRAALADLELGQGDRESKLIQLLSGSLKQPTPGLLSSLLSLTGAGLGAYKGGQFGGAIGGEAGNILGSMFEPD